MVYKVLAACGAGIGTSMIIKKNIQEVFDQLNLEVEITHESLGVAKSKLNEYDIVFTLAALAENFKSEKGYEKVVGLHNIVSKEEIRDALHKVLEI